jgi:hypothetical protein
VRRTLQMLGYGLLCIFSVGTLIAIVDWFGRWDWFKQLMENHPRYAAFVRSPFSYLFLLFIGLMCLFAEIRLKKPRIVGKFLNSRITPNLKTTTMQVVFDSDAKRAGWDEHKLDWEWFVQVQLANDSDTPTTIEQVRVTVVLKRKWGKRERVRAEHSEDLDNFLIDMGLDESLNALPFEGERYRKIASLMEQIRGTPLTKGIGYHGWLHFKVCQVSQKDMNGGHISINIQLVDALEGKHKLDYRKDEESWNKRFLVFKRLG